MRIIECEQGSEEWVNAHIGVASASQFDRIVTPKGKPSAQADGYLAELVAGWVMKAPLDDYVSAFMERGLNLEEQAAAFYEFKTDRDTRKVGFCLLDDADIGCSPDRLVGDDGLVETKCPSTKVHVAYLLGLDDVVAKYRCQAQGQLWVTERQWVDVVSYSPVPELPSVIVRVERDEEFIEALQEHVTAFAGRVVDAKMRVAGMLKALEAA